MVLDVSSALTALAKPSSFSSGPSSLIQLIGMPVERRHWPQLHPQHPSLEMPHRILELITRVLPCTGSEHLIELLKRKTFRFRHAEQNQAPQNYAPCSIPSKRTLRLECREQMWPGE